MAQGSPSLNRRSVLKAAGITAGVLAAAPLLASLDNASLKVGLLLPRADGRLTPGARLLAGMQTFFDGWQKDGKGRGVRLVTESIGLGGGQALAKSTKLIEAGRVDFVVALVGARVATTLSGLFHDRRIPLIVTRAGANVAPPASSDAFVFHNSLNTWQASRAMGVWAAESLGRRAVVAQSLYDSAYDAVHAFRYGFEQAGGQVAGVYTTHDPRNSGDLRTALDAIRRSRPDFVYGSYHGDAAIDFVRAYAGAGLSGQIPLAGSAFMTDEAILSQQGEAALGILTALPWAGALDTSGNQIFVNAYQQATGQPPDAFALLGYDTAQWIAQADQHATGLAEALRRAEFGSPRGALSILLPAQHVGGPIYLREVRRQGGALQNAVVGQLDSFSPLDEHIAAWRAQQQSGCLNPYLA